MNNYFEKIPLAVINFITVLSGVLTIITSILSILAFFKFESFKLGWACISFILFLFSLVLFVRMRKYRMLANMRIEKTSENYKQMLHSIKDLYFEVLHSYKTNGLSTSSLNSICESKLKSILANLCETFYAFTNKPVSACIKLVCYSITDENEDVTVDDVKLITFCRSPNSSSERGAYENGNSKPIWLKENTDFLEIISDENFRDYFYQKNLPEYVKKLQTEHKTYKNSNPNWENDYKATIVVPIKIEFSKLYHLNGDDSFHTLGFLCIDSQHTDAFTEKQEKYNVDLARSYAEIIYLVLSKYKYYLYKIKEKKGLLKV